MQNNAFIHVIKKLKLWLQKMNIKIMNWSSYNFNLNSIENLWALLKKKAYKVYSNLNSLQNKDDEVETQLFQILQQA